LTREIFRHCGRRPSGTAPVTPHVELRGHVTALLGALGADEDEVASTLRRQAVTGTPRDVRDCALARYIAAVIGSDPAVRSTLVFQDRVKIRLTGFWPRRVVVTLPVPVKAFVYAFDTEHFPELEIEPAGSPSSVAGLLTAR
jgi:hypothetical protein